MRHLCYRQNCNTWQQIKDEWVSAYMNREVIPEFSVMRQVTAKDEWCAEAYLESRYDRLTDDDYLEAIQNFYLFSMKNAEEDVAEGEDEV